MDEPINRTEAEGFRPLLGGAVTATGWDCFPPQIGVNCAKQRRLCSLFLGVSESRQKGLAVYQHAFAEVFVLQWLVVGSTRHQTSKWRPGKAVSETASLGVMAGLHSAPTSRRATQTGSSPMGHVQIVAGPNQPLAQDVRADYS